MASWGQKWWGGLLLGAAVLCLPQPVLAQESGSKAVNVYAKAQAVAARAPGLMVRDGIAGPLISQTRADSEQPARQQGVLIDMINAIFVGLNQLIPLLPTLLQFGDGSPSGVGDLIITEIANDGEPSP